MSDKVNLTAVKIFEQQFSVVPQGYDADDVDQLLDLVIEDYQLFESQQDNIKAEAKKTKEDINDLNKRNKELTDQSEAVSRQNKLLSDQKTTAENRVTEVLRQSEEIHNADLAKIEGLNLEITSLKERIKELETKLAEQTTPQTYNQLEVLKRIARIEQKVFGKD